MFGNLKSKIGDVAELKKYASPQLLSSLTGSRQRSTQHTPGTQTPSLSKHSRQPSDASLSGTASASVSYTTLLEQNESDVSDVNKENIEKLNKDVEKLKSALEAQQDVALQRLSAKEQEWKNKHEEDQKKIALLEKELNSSKIREEDLQQTLLDKKKEISVSIEHTVEKDAKLKGMEQKLINLQDNYDQLEGLGTQEVAKVKHLLLNATSDLENARKELEEKSMEVNNLQKRLTTFEGLEHRINTLSEEKMDLETKIAGLSQKLNTANNRHVSESEEHEEEIKHFKEKIAMLEKRCSTETVQDSEKDKAFVKERESYEHKLEESRQQLHNIKSSWSDKITALETQIQNLNEKIAEDQMDLKSSEETNEDLRKQISELHDEKKTASEDNERILVTLREENERAKEDLVTSKWQLETESNNKNQEIKELRRNLHLQEEKGKQLSEDLEIKKEKVEKLQQNLTELNNKFIELESNALELETKCCTLESSNNSLQDFLNRERTSCESLEQELHVIKTKHNVVSLEKSKLLSNLDEYLEKVNQYTENVKLLEDEKIALNDRIRRLDSSLGDYETRNQELLKVVRELESDFESKIENSDLVQELREKLKCSEDEVSEKKQMLKVQSQRIADMKKTIQRELRINPDSSESISDFSGFVNQSRPRLPSDNQNPSSIFKPRKNSVIQNGSHEFDDVNLEYLKHVVIKFITSREYEAVQLTRAVSTLLHMTEDEENLLRETLEWKMSWFGARPNIGKGQMAKAIPPSQ